MQSMGIIEQAPYGNAQIIESNKRSVDYWDLNIGTKQTD